MKKIFIFALMLSLLACRKDNAEENAQRMLSETRQALSEKRFSDARDSIMSLRKTYPTAIQARAEAILLLDSIEMEAASDSMKNATGAEWERLDIKHRFYKRKLEEDIKKTR